VNGGRSWEGIARTVENGGRERSPGRR